LRVKVFIWLVFRNSILTRDNLLKRGWEGSEKCCFFCEKQTVDHMLLNCPVARYTWSVVACMSDNNCIPAGVGEVCAWVKRFKTIEMRQLVASGVSAVF
jgi:hypothetical protein